MASGQIKAFSYVNADKAWLYRAVMSAFIKEHFSLQLRLTEIAQHLQMADLRTNAVSNTELEAALSQLCEWGNLEAHADTAEVSTVEEFYRPRFLYQLSLAAFLCRMF